MAAPAAECVEHGQRHAVVLEKKRTTRPPLAPEPDVARKEPGHGARVKGRRTASGRSRATAPTSTEEEEGQPAARGNLGWVERAMRGGRKLFLFLK
jgi:hypothetical protein